MVARAPQSNKGGSFLFEEREPHEVFTREDISEEQQMFARRRRRVHAQRGAHARRADLLERLGRHARVADQSWRTRPAARRHSPKSMAASASIKSARLTSASRSLCCLRSAAASARTPLSARCPSFISGTEQQRAKYLPKLATGELIAAYCLTEPSSGSDAMAAKTKATLSADGKYYHAQRAEDVDHQRRVCRCLHRLCEGGRRKNSPPFIVERGPGVVSGHEEKKLGLDGSSTTALMLEDCQVPVENVLGEIGKGHVVALQSSQPRTAQARQPQHRRREDLAQPGDCLR